MSFFWGDPRHDDEEDITREVQHDSDVRRLVVRRRYACRGAPLAKEPDSDGCC